ncbi:MAG: NAD(P)(+) transhydrogenase (Re/Si-specific) subunit beta, partial [Geminicoccaceae bacterium]
MSTNLAAVGYLVAAVCFIMALRGLSSAATSRMGNRYGMAGMAIAVAITLLALSHPGPISYLLIILGIAIGGGIGFIVAKRIEMTAMPQLVAAFHSLVGLAAVFVAAAAFLNPGDFHITNPDGTIKGLSLAEMGLGTIIGAITFSGSLIAFGKLQAKLPPAVENALGPLKGIVTAAMSSKPILLPGRHVINIAVGLAILVLLVLFVRGESG